MTCVIVGSSAGGAGIAAAAAAVGVGAGIAAAAAAVGVGAGITAAAAAVGVGAVACAADGPDVGAGGASAPVACAVVRREGEDDAMEFARFTGFGRPAWFGGRAAVLNTGAELEGDTSAAVSWCSW